MKVAATQAGLSLKQLAEQSGVSASSIYQHVRGITTVPPALLSRIAVVTRVHPSFFDPERDARQTLALPLDAVQVEVLSPLAAGDAAVRLRLESELRQAGDVVEAYRSSSSMCAPYLAALDRMLSLARALEDNQQQASMLCRMGRAHIEDGRFGPACRFLKEARNLAEQGSEIWAEATLDLAFCLREREDDREADDLLEALTTGPWPQKWRAYVEVGRARTSAADFEGAIEAFEHAARSVLGLSSRQQQAHSRAGLISGLAALASRAGNFHAGLLLWLRVQDWAEQEQQVGVYLDASCELAICEIALGRLTAARATLERVSALCTFTASLQRRHVRPLSILAGCQAAVGLHDAAQESAKQAMRSSSHSGTAGDAISASLAMAEMRLAGGQFAVAQEYASDAAAAATRVHRQDDLAAALILRARAQVGSELSANPQPEQPNLAANQLALSDALEAVDAAERGFRSALAEEAMVLAAEIHVVNGHWSAAKSLVSRLLDGEREMPSGLALLRGERAAALRTLLASEIDLRALFPKESPGRPPLVERRVQLLAATLAEQAGDMRKATSFRRRAAELGDAVMDALTPVEARSFSAGRHRHAPLITAHGDLTLGDLPMNSFLTGDQVPPAGEASAVVRRSERSVDAAAPYRGTEEQIS